MIDGMYKPDFFRVDPNDLPQEYCEEPVVDEEDWDLGPACGLDPEVCESCQ